MPKSKLAHSARSHTYTIRLRGEQHSFEVAAWTSVSLKAACAVLSDVTGYKPEAIERWIGEAMTSERNRVKVVEISHAERGGFDARSTPSFVISRD